MGGHRGFVASADSRASEAGAAVLRSGGNAADAAIAANAVLAVTSPHLCGLGGDLFALVFDKGAVSCLTAAGRAGSGSDAAALRAEGRTTMPLFGDPRSVTVPGCMDGLVTLHERFGSLALAELFAPAVALARAGFVAGAPLSSAVGRLGSAARAALIELTSQVTRPDSTVRRPGVARTLSSVAATGRDGFYRGEFGQGLVTLNGSPFAADDLVPSCAEWREPLKATAWGVDLWVAPPPSQGYLMPAAAQLADAFGLPATSDPAWAHLLIECAAAASLDRADMLFDGADGVALMRRSAARRHIVDPDRAGPVTDGRAGDTTYLCATDSAGMAVSLIQSNASGFGAQLVEPSTQINLHNRGLGFSLEAGHPAELRPGRRPPHTLVPALATDDDGLRAVFGTMGGDAQPQILLQLAARLFHHAGHPKAVVEAGRWVLRGESGFDTWTGTDVAVAVEGHAPVGWSAGLAARGHRVVRLPAFDSAFGHAHVIARLPDGAWAAAADPRTVIGSAVEA